MNTFESEPPPMNSVDLIPPWWRRPLSHLEGTQAGDLGFPDHHPARPGHDQKEDVLTPQFARQGYSSHAVVASSSSSSSQSTLAPPIAVAIETVSLAGPIYEKLKKNGMVQRLEAMSREVEKERGKLRGAVDQVPPHTYRPPTRTILNPLMRQNFLSTLANPSIPLSKLSRNVPHGIKGEGMLELVWKSKVGVDRVGWFVGVVGGLEVQAGRSRMAINSTNAGGMITGPSTPTTGTSTTTPALPVLSAEETYTIEFTRTFFGWMKKHLVEIIPAGSNSHNGSEVEGMMGDCLLDDEERRRVWVEKWEYIRSLAFHFKNRCFLHPRTITRWFTSEITESHIIPLNFILDLLDGFHRVVLPSLGPNGQSSRKADGVWGRRLIGACLARLKVIREMRQGEFAKPLERPLGAIVKTGWQTDRRYFLSPRTWRLHEDLLREIICGISVPLENEVEFDRLKSRNNWLSMHIRRPVARSTTSAQSDKGKGREASPVTSATSVDKLLDKVTSDTPDPIKTLIKTLFGGDAFGRDRRAATRSRIIEILDWMMRRRRVDPRSAIIGSGVIKQAIMDDFEPVLNLALDQAKERSRRYHFVTAIVLEWIDRLVKDVHRAIDALDSVVDVLGRVVQIGLIDYEDYLGYMVTIADTDESSFARDILAQLPYFGQDETVIFQRRMLLHGSDMAGQALEKQRIHHSALELRSYLGDLVDLNAVTSSHSSREPNTIDVSSAWICSQVWVHIRSQVLQSIQALKSDGDLGSTRMARLITVATIIPDYELLFEVCKRMAQVSVSDAGVQLACCQQLQRNLLLWDAMSCGQEARNLAETLRTNTSNIITHRYTSSGIGQIQDLSIGDGLALPNALNSTAQLFREVVEIHRQPSLDAVDRLAQSLIKEFPNDRQLGEQVWNLALAGLADIDITLLQPEGESKAVEATVRLLQTLGANHPGMWDMAFRRWARSVLRKPTLATVNEQSCSLLLELVSKRVLSIRSVLEGLLLPLWRSMAAFVSSATQAVPEQSRFVLVLSRAIFRSHTIGSAISLSTAHALAAELELALEDTALATNLIKHLPFLAVIAVNTSSSHDMARFLGELCHVEPLKIFALREQAVVREAVTKAPFSWEGHQKARDLVENCVSDLLNASASTEKATSDTFLSDWPCLSIGSDAETQIRVKAAIRRSITTAGKNVDKESDALSILFQTRLTVTHRIAIFDGLSRLGTTVIKAFIAQGIKYLHSLYEENRADSKRGKQNILHHAMDIVWMFACAWTVSDAGEDADSEIDAPQYDTESVFANLESICCNIGTGSSHASVLDGALLAVIRSFGETGLTRSGNSRSLVLGLCELLTRSTHGEDLYGYLLDELPESEMEYVLSIKDDGADVTRPPTTLPADTYFNSVWENTTTGIDDPYSKVTLENADPIDLAAFQPTFMWENANKTPLDLSSLMRRPPTERDLDLGTTTLPLFARSMLYDLYETIYDTNNNDASSSTRGRSMSATPRSYGTGNDPIEIADSPPPVTTKSKKRPYPQESPVKNQKKLDRKASTSAKPIAPAPKRKTKRE